MMWWVLWAKVTLQPLYSDVRFEPTDKLHAGCTNSADVLFSPQGQKITHFTLVLYYNPENIEILRIIPSTNNGEIVNSNIEYNKIILDVQNPNFTSLTQATSFFQIYFKSNIVGKESLVLGTWSKAITTNKTYLLTDTFPLEFAKVLECEPDIIPPSISLIYPKDTQQKIALDQYFIFDVKDIGKGIDKNSVIINFDGEQYVYGSDNLKRNGNSLSFYPGKWIPINKQIKLKISVTDKQSYGWANKTQSTYDFQTATGIVFDKDVSPILFRQISQEAGKISASTNECVLLSNFYKNADTNSQKILKSIIQKIWCNLTDVSLLTSTEDGIDKTEDKNIILKQYKNISFFAALWWILFFIAFTLKIHYILGYVKHKRLHEKSKNSL